MKIIKGGSLPLKTLSDAQLKQAYIEACKLELAKDFINVLHDELLLRGIPVEQTIK